MLLIILFILVALYYIGYIDLYDYKSWLRIIVGILLIYLIKFIYSRLKNKNTNFNYKGLEKDFLKKVKTSIPVSFIDLKPKKKKRINKTENECRKIIEKIYKKPFPSIRPSFLKSPKTGHNLELDCYNKDLQIALEYNGEQHYKYLPVWHKSKKDFYKQVFHDDFKREKCHKLGIKLIEVPYWEQYNLETFIMNELRKRKCL